MLSLRKDKELRDRLRENALKFVENYSWEKRNMNISTLVDSLIKK